MQNISTIALIYWPSTENYTVWAFDSSYETLEEWKNRLKNNEIYKANWCRIQIITGTIEDL